MAPNHPGNEPDPGDMQPDPGESSGASEGTDLAEDEAEAIGDFA